ESVQARSASAELERTLQAELMKTSAGKKLRVFEIGGGTGGTSRPALRCLGGTCAQYVFTDISSAFLGQSFLKEFPNVETRKFDVERPPDEQEVAEAAFDVVLAANVLHATSDLDLAIGHSLRLLKPGGKLIIIEGTRENIWLDLTFGLTAGWWKFTDDRTRSPLLDVDEWLVRLDRAGLVRAHGAVCSGQHFGAWCGPVVFTAERPVAELLRRPREKAEVLQPHWVNLRAEKWDPIVEVDRES